MTMTSVIVREPARMKWSWPPLLIAIMLLSVAVSLLAFPLWVTLLTNYRSDNRNGKESWVPLKSNDTNDARSVFTAIANNVFNGLACFVLDVSPRLAASSLTIYISLCLAYVGLAHLGFLRDRPRNYY